MKRFLTALTAFSFLFVAYGCGQSGPLYIPGNPSRIEQPPPADEDAQAEEETEADGNGEEEE